jgi:hypothetical protein
MEASDIGTGNGAGSKATQFKPGWKGGPGRPRASHEGEPVTSASPLDDMGHVYSNPASKDKTPGQKRCRQFLEEDFKAFVTLYMKLVEAHRAEVAAAANPDSSDDAPIGPQEERVLELAERLLAEWEEEEMRGQNG